MRIPKQIKSNAVVIFKPCHFPTSKDHINVHTRSFFLSIYKNSQNIQTSTFIPSFIHTIITYINIIFDFNMVIYHSISMHEKWQHNCLSWAFLENKSMLVILGHAIIWIFQVPCRLSMKRLYNYDLLVYNFHAQRKCFILLNFVLIKALSHTVLWHSC